MNGWALGIIGIGFFVAAWMLDTFVSTAALVAFTLAMVAVPFALTGALSLRSLVRAAVRSDERRPRR